MTQLIGAICDQKKKVLMLSDRQVEREGLVFERGSKGVEISRTGLALTAGTAHEPVIIDTLRDKYLTSSPPPAMVDLIQELIDKFQEVRISRLTNEIIRPRGFKSLSEYYAKQKVLHESLTIDMNSQISEYELGLGILVGCIDKKGAHISIVADPGTEYNYDTIGFLCPGMGKEQAEATFVMYNFSPDMSLEEALQIAYLAKERGRMAGGVGQATDGWIIDEEKIDEIPQDKFKELRQFWSKKNILD